MIEPPEQYKLETISPSMWSTTEDDLAFVQQYGIECDSMACKTCNELTTINRCPTCGTKLKMRSAGEHQCQCGTLLWICKMVGQTPIVAAFAVRSPAAKLINVLGDTI